MAEDSKIQWTTHTWNPWRGCTKVSAGCANCYAETLSGRNPGTLGVWGPNGTRVVAAEGQWSQPLKWDKAAKAAGERHRVFCASLADVFEDWDGPMVDAKGTPVFYDPSRRQEPWAAVYEKVSGCRSLTMQDVRKRLFDLIDRTPHLDWLLLTKRPENIVRMVNAAARSSTEETSDRIISTFMNRVWVGTSVENQQAADERIPHLLRVPAAVRFLSMEPLLGPVDLRPKAPDAYSILGRFYHTGTFDPTAMGPGPDRVLNCFPKLHWVIVGGESGHGARPFDLAWARDLRDQCQAAGVPFFLKQTGENVVGDGGVALRFRKKGGELDDIPEDLRIREFPEVTR